MEKKKLGFETPTQKMQDELEEILKLLSEKELSWSVLVGYSVRAVEDFKAVAISAQKQGMATPEMVTMTSLPLYIHVVMSFIGRLGTDIAEANKRLAAVEESIKQLSRKIK